MEGMTPGNGGRDPRLPAGKRAPSKSERRVLQIFEATPAPAVIVRVRDGRYKVVNSAFLQTFGYTRKEVAAKTGGELGIWRDEQTAARLWKRTVAGRSVEGFETQLHTKAGKVVDVLLYVDAIELDDDRCLIASIIDITERKRMEEALRVANQQLRILSRRRGQVQEEERKRLSRELHDHVGQLVTACAGAVVTARAPVERMVPAARAARVRFIVCS